MRRSITTENAPELKWELVPDEGEQAGFKTIVRQRVGDKLNLAIVYRCGQAIESFYEEVRDTPRGEERLVTRHPGSLPELLLQKSEEGSRRLPGAPAGYRRSTSHETFTLKRMNGRWKPVRITHIG